MLLCWACICLLAGSVVGQSSRAASAVSSSPVTGVTDIPVYNATISGTPNDTSVQSYPDEAQCNYTSSEDLYCFPTQDSFVQMTGWTRFFYNPGYGLINNSGLVDITMHFAADDQPAASWIGVQNTGNVPINVNISWFTSTLSSQATNSAADPYYFYVRPNSAVYNAFPTGSSRGPTFYAVQTPVARLAVPATAAASSTGNAAAAQPTSNVAGSAATNSPTSTTAAQNKSGTSSGLSRGAIAGIAIGAIALFFALLLLAIVIVLLLRRKRYAEEAAAVAAANQEKQRHRDLVTGNLYTPAELAAAGVSPPRQYRRPSVDQTDSSGSMPYIIHQNPLSHQSSIK
ncbi:protein of unknown function [Taphrina deformans PYCC 5710]|uniref:Uncharacterized protein n=1 Tax=Taphrina deformans (strain PYCC 5710 / ATCC 11124 / CBS 356.35 / IMI 108563 / JCM 9778 / NBRC 8474) TaxID=1097556 RepID=R4X8S0_TAPDE|nr:protein of unknown function [Taphrina deformans PYCC 5710]|eukprot:CCG82038.1 protein of unknown function [Taphrina deformans PYCC 5710]